ncbi:dienelactone hydrolase [Paenibacillus shirakamiensis]|uniref:Dienelactone hydrolase n=1 Tax=Paenibacillus shirakamiensis TaxID=1265935 RepID=A0ABS4JJ40_9BACL|nr:alpha/beta fold hydrolase [Paenibacillus shirakamiensis]MBP2001707.1 dienelactone hydrolase [Paenibacillus shirakamiensis]
MKKYIVRSVTAAALTAMLTLPAAQGLALAKSTLVPVRQAAATIGAGVVWNAKSQTVTLTKGTTKLVLTVNKTKATLNGKTVTIKEPLKVIKNQAMVAVDQLKVWFKPQSTGTPSTPVPPTPPSTPVTTGEVADLFIQGISTGDATKAEKYMTPALKLSIPTAALQNLWKGYSGLYGDISSQLSKSTKVNAIHTNVTYTFKTSQTSIDIIVRLNKEGKVDDLYVQPTNAAVHQSPSYDRSTSYTEEEVQIGEGIFALPGTFTKPIGTSGAYPVIVLVHGSGPSDRDESIGGAKIFKDLAAGLASQGIGVLRYDKITYEHTFKFAANPIATILQETVNDALQAVRYVRNQPNVDKTKIYVAGHSQGGFAVPLIINADANEGNIRGSIILSGPSGTFIDVMKEQNQELITRVKSQGGDTTPYEKNATLINTVAQLLQDPRYSVDNLPTNFPLPSAYWWYALNNYKPTDLAKTQRVPLLILAGENDWQVPLDQFATWKKELANRSDIEYKSYPKVNHLLAEYDGVSTSAEYTQPSHVSESIINDIVAWAKKDR